MRGLRRTSLLAAALALFGCDRNLEPYDPEEQPHQPDLSRIFPAGAERVGRAEPGLPEAPGGRGAPSLAAESGEPIRGTVRLSPELEGRVPTGAVLFLIARNPAGGPPLAVKRIPSPSFPLDFEIGPDDRMIEAMPFAGSMMLSARIDADGNATSRTPGDLLGAAADPLEPGATGVEVVIDQSLSADDAAQIAASPPAAQNAPAAAARSAPVQGTVRIAPELAARIPDGAVLFVIARRGEGGPPLAVKRIGSPSFPLDFELGPDDRMIQTMPFAGPLTITARVDSDGNAMSRAPGDLFGDAAAPVDPGATGVEVLIDAAVPSAPEG